MSLEQQVVRLAIFFGLLTVSAHLVKLVKQSPFIVYIVLGALLGPALADFVPEPHGLDLIGFLGVTLSIANAGLCTRLPQIRTAAPRASVVATLGVVFPIAGACLVMVLYDGASLKSAFAVGAAIAPTSLGVTAAMLSDVGELKSDLGVMISVAAIFDDVMSLILLSELEALNHASTWLIIQPILFSAVFILMSLLVTALFFPFLLRRCNAFFTNERYYLFSFYFFVCFSIGLMAVAVRAKTSTLLAAYVAGVAFSDFNHVQTAWAELVKSYIPGLDALFFACTIGFVIPPLKDLFDKSSLILGALLTVVSILGKFSCALGMWPNWWTNGVPVAIAMLARGEFGFLIAKEAREQDLIDQKVYAAVIWAVIVPTLLGPILFRPAFNMRARRLDQMKLDGSVDGSDDDGALHEWNLSDDDNDDELQKQTFPDIESPPSRVSRSARRNSLVLMAVTRNSISPEHRISLPTPDSVDPTKL